MDESSGSESFSSTIEHHDRDLVTPDHLSTPAPANLLRPYAYYATPAAYYLGTPLPPFTRFHVSLIAIT